MDFNLKAPPVLKGTEREQLHQIRSYLYQMQESLVIALDGLNPDKMAQDAANAVIGAQKLPDGTGPTLDAAYKALKSIIIKTANTVKSEVEEITQRLESDYVATSDFGAYQERAINDMRATATEVVNSYSYDSKLVAMQNEIAAKQSALDALLSSLNATNTAISNINNYNVSTQQYIKSGLLFFDDMNIPRYGVAVGENLTTVEVNGEVVIERSGLAATFTSDRLSFWQNEVEVAYISNNVLYINEITILSRLFLGNWVMNSVYGFTLKWAGNV